MNTRQTITDLRDTLGWTNTKLAEASGLPESTVRRYLTGIIDTGTEKADRMLAALRNAEK